MKESPEHILVVDDLPTNRKLLRAVLEEEGYTVTEAVDGVDALEALQRGRIDAVISDILMPRMDGYRFCLAARKIGRYRSVPFIIYTSTYISPGDEKLALDSGADRYIRKPAPAQTILDTLHELFKGSRVPANPPVSGPAELEVMKEYSEALIRKLEDKNRELEEARELVARANEDLERRVHERTAELEDANTELEAFSRSVAHDLRNPLAVILGFASMLQSACERKLDEMEMKCVRKIVESSGRMEALITDLLKLSHGTHAEIHLHPVDLGRLARDIIHKLQEAEPGRSVEVTVAPEAVANADAQLLHIALENLLGNAWKFTGKKERARIEFGVMEKSSDGPVASTRNSSARSPEPSNISVFFVRDNGAGFDMAAAEKLFRPFQRLHPSADFTGTGIGLTTVHRIVRRHGGRIWAESAPEQGTTFYFTL